MLDCQLNFFSQVLFVDCIKILSVGGKLAFHETAENRHSQKREVMTGYQSTGQSTE